MARACGGGFHRQCSSEKFEDSDRPCSEMQEFHVLAVDDSFVDRKIIERLLKISSCKVTAVESGKRALQFLGLDEEKSSVGSNGLKVHLIITDYTMPGMTGYELLKRIKESATFKEVPVVIMSSENILNRIERCLEEGAKEYIVKPVKLSDVKRLKEFMVGDYHSSFKSIGDETRDFSLPTSSSSKDCIVNPQILGHPCSSPKCFCISRRPRFRTRSSTYHHHSQLSFY